MTMLLVTILFLKNVHCLVSGPGISLASVFSRRVDYRRPFTSVILWALDLEQEQVLLVPLSSLALAMLFNTQKVSNNSLEEQRVEIFTAV